MNIRQQNVVILLTDEGHDALQLAIPDVSESRTCRLYVQDSDDMGLWVRIRRPDGDHLLWVRWEFIITIDVLIGETREIGLRPRD